MKNILIHIPHSSYIIPEKYKDLFYLKDDELFQEQIKMSAVIQMSCLMLKEFKNS